MTFLISVILNITSGFYLIEKYLIFYEVTGLKMNAAKTIINEYSKILLKDQKQEQFFTL